MGQLEDMSVFVRVVEAGGISRAAEQLNIAKSVVSRRLADLETRLGAKLLHRTTRSIKLTEAGKTYYERALKILDDVLELDSSTAQTQTSLQGKIRVAAPISFGLLHLTPAIEAFIRLHPNLSVDIDFSDRHVDLVESGIDIAIRIGKLADSSLMARHLTAINLCVCASPAYIDAYGCPDTIDALDDHQLLHYSGSASNMWRLYDKDGRDWKHLPHSKLSANNGDFLKAMALAGHGIIYVPTFIVWQELKQKTLVKLLPGYTTDNINAYAVYPQTRYLSQRVRIFIDFLVERFGDTPYWDESIS